MAGRPRGLSLGQPHLAAGPGPKARPPLRMTLKTGWRTSALSTGNRCVFRTGNALIPGWSSALFPAPRLRSRHCSSHDIRINGFGVSGAVAVVRTYYRHRHDLRHPHASQCARPVAAFTARSDGHRIPLSSWCRLLRLARRLPREPTGVVP
jgi:hypothetical protein